MILEEGEEKMKNKLNIFISYRRIDSSHFSGRLNDGLNSDFDVFYDTEGGIGYGEDFLEILREGIEKADIVLMIIGSKSCEEFESREGKSDFILYEILHAQKNSCKIIPILIDGVAMPKCFPKEISFVKNLNAYEFKNKFSIDLNTLIKEIRKMSPKKYIICKERKEEIENHITSNNLNEATLRLMDFAQDFAQDRQRKSDSKDIRAKFNFFKAEEKQFGISEKSIAQYSELRYQIFDLIENIIIEFQDKSKPSSTKSTVFSTPSIFKAKENFKTQTSNIVFNANKLTKEYKKKRLMQFSLKPIDITLNYGEITALVGENGSGKTTLLNMIAGELLHSSGEVEYPALESKKNKDDYYHIKTQISYVPQEITKWDGYVVDNLHYTLAIDGIKGQENIDEVNFILHRLGLEKFIDAKWNEISGGYKMRFALARAMLRQPKLLILDEPLSHLDINSAKIFLNDIKSLVNSNKNKMSAIISSQHIYELEDIADNIIFLKEGHNSYNGLVKVFGANRKKNIYELNIDIEVNKLVDILKTIDDVKIEVTGENYIVEVPIYIEEKMFINILWEHNLTVKYFRNISQSTRSLFMKDEK